MPRLPRESSLTCWKCQACHAKGRGVHGYPFVAKLPRTSIAGSEHATPATQSKPDMLKAPRLMQVLKAPRLPRKSSLTCWKRHACQAKGRDVHGYPFVAELPRTSMQALKVSRLPRKSSLTCWKCHACNAEGRGVHAWLPARRQGFADIYAGTEGVTRATQIEPDILKVPRLSRKRPRRPWDPFVAELPRTSL